MNLVIGGSVEQAVNWIKSHGYDRNTFLPVSDENKILGCKDGTIVILVGQFFQNNAFRYIVDNGLDKIRFVLVTEF